MNEIMERLFLAIAKEMNLLIVDDDCKERFDHLWAIRDGINIGWAALLSRKDGTIEVMERDEDGKVHILMKVTPADIGEGYEVWTKDNPPQLIRNVSEMAKGEREWTEKKRWNS